RARAEGETSGSSRVVSGSWGRLPPLLGSGALLAPVTALGVLNTANRQPARLRSTGQRAERRYAGFNSPIPAVAAAEAQAVAVTPAGGKDVAGGEADAVLQRLVEQSVAVDRLWKFDTQHEPTRRAAHLCPARKAARDRANHLVDILGKGSP